MAHVQQVKTAIGENSLLTACSRLDGDGLKFVHRFELSGHIEVGSMSNARFQMEVPVIQGKSMS